MMQEFLDLLVKLSKWPGASSALVNIPKVNIQFVNVAIIWVPKEMDGVSCIIIIIIIIIITNYYELLLLLLLLLRIPSML